MGLDIVYIVKDNRKNDELRYSLRSLKNLPHNRVWIFGSCPDWITNVEFVPFKQTGASKWERAGRVLERVAEETRLDDFVFFNDDFFVINPIENLEYYKHGKLKNRIIYYGDKRVSGLPKRIMQAEQALIKRGKPTDNFELHIPIKFNRAKLAKICEIYPGLGAKRSLYCNEYGIKGKERNDVKVHTTLEGISSKDFVSTNDMNFSSGRIGKEIRERFKEKSIYEN